MTAWITCPRCGMTSHHPEDVRHGYCGHCHDWTSEPRHLPDLTDPDRFTGGRITLVVDELEGTEPPC